MCTNPHEQYIEEGREQGRIDGRRDGLKQGYAIGHTTALEYGMEVGFIQGVLSTVAPHLTGLVVGDEKKVASIQRSLKHVQTALDAFPCPEEVLQSADPNRLAMRDQTNNSEDPADEDLDIVGKMQRIRTRFKLLMVQLGTPSLSLKSMMDKGIIDGTGVSSADW